MSFLKKFGMLILKATSIVTGMGPLFASNPSQAALVATASTDLHVISGIILSVEAMGQALELKGADKLTAATPLVAQVILKSSILAGHKIKDDALFLAGSKKIADGMADVLNSLEDNGITVTSVT